MNPLQVLLKIKQSLFIGCLIFYAGNVIPHGADYLEPTSEQLKEVQPPLEGAKEFAETLANNARGIFDSEHLLKVDQAVKCYDVANQIKNKFLPNVNPAYGAYNHWIGDQNILDAVGSIENIKTFDFSDPANSPELHHKTSLQSHNRILVWKIRIGEGPTKFITRECDIIRERYALLYTINLPQSGTVYLALKLKDVPSFPGKFVFQFKKENEPNPFSWHSLEYHPEPIGQIALTVLNEKKKPTPCLIRIKSRKTGALWPPAEHFDFQENIQDVSGPETPPMLNIYGESGSFQLRIPGKFRGLYWVISGQIEETLPIGEWELTVYRGIETNPVIQNFTIKNNETNQLEINLTRIADMKSKGWISGDDHVHARLINSLDANGLITLTKAMDVHVSNILEMGNSERTFFPQRGYGDKFRVEDDGYWLIPGMEDPRSFLGHNIGLNLTSLVRDLDYYLQLDWIAEQVRAQGALFGQTHVGQNVCEADRGMALMVPLGAYDFCSIMQNHLGTELYYDSLDLGYQLSATAGSDMPYGGILGDVRMYAFIGDQKFTPDIWFDAIKKGNTFVSNGPMLEFEIEGSIPGDTIKLSESRKLNFKVKAWGTKGETAPSAIEIIRFSQPLDTFRLSSNEQTTIEAEGSFDPGEGCWVAARAWGLNGSAAHTTPIWTRSQDKVYRNKERLKEVVKKQTAILDEIEAEIVAVEKMKKENRLSPFDFWNIPILEQEKQIRELILKSRKEYQIMLEQK